MLIALSWIKAHCCQCLAPVKSHFWPFCLLTACQPPDEPVHYKRLSHSLCVVDLCCIYNGLVKPNRVLVVSSGSFDRPGLSGRALPLKRKFRPNWFIMPNAGLFNVVLVISINFIQPTTLAYVNCSPTSTKYIKTNHEIEVLLLWKTNE